MALAPPSGPPPPEPVHSGGGPFVSAGVAPVAGRVRVTDADFFVDEQRLYECSGAGTHLHFRIEKRGLPTSRAVRALGKALGVPPRDVGYAGMKDARALARQWLSVEHVDEAALRGAAEQVDGVELLEVARHGNKLRLGHLAGNRFRIVVRDVAEHALGRAREVLDGLRARGAPNWFGDRRFGQGGGNAAIGAAIVRGDDEEAARLVRESSRSGATGRDLTPAAALRRVPRRLMRLWVSAYQSALWNRLASARMADPGRLETGDLAYLHDRGAVFEVTDSLAEQARADRLEISPTAPLFGSRTALAGGAPGGREAALLRSEGLEPAAFRKTRAGEMRGERRPIRVPLRDAAVRAIEGGDALELTFTLPRGSYATSVLRELGKGAIVEAERPR